MPTSSQKPLTVPFVDLSIQHQSLLADFQQALSNVLTRGDFVLGEALQQFEAAWAAASGSRYGVGVASGTDALTLGLQACGIGRGDEVLLPSNTFVATLIGVQRTGATPVLVDCDPATGLIDLLAASQRVSAKTKAIVVVHLYGQMVSPSQLRSFALAHDLMVFEDAAQAHLAEREGQIAGSLGMAAAFSFYPSKNLGALGDGGMVVTPDESVAKMLRSLRNYGAPKKYFHVEQGINSRLDTFQAAVLQIKLPHLAGWNRDRNRLAQRYDEMLRPLRNWCQPLANESGEGHVYHLYLVTLAAEVNRAALQETLEARGVQSGVHYPLPCHLQPAFRDLGYQLGDFPHTERHCQTILSLPMYPGLADAQQDYVVEVLESALTQSVQLRRAS
jgi:dTDP-4-amino-4,6-dideoxygalactose transaminase